MLPVLEHAGWQVESIVIDLGIGLREWIELRHDDERIYVKSVAERDVELCEHGVNPRDLAELAFVDDGCE